MPKPHGTFLQLAKIAKIKLRASGEKSNYRIHQVQGRRLQLGRFDLRSARNVAYRACDFGTESTSRGDTVRKALSELVDHLSEMKEKIDSFSELHSEVREPHFEFRAVRQDAGPINASNVLVIAMAAITLLMALEKVLLNSGKNR